MPLELYSALPTDLHEICSDLTLLELKGQSDSTVVVSVMLHGNEPSGLYALQWLLKSLGEEQPYRTLLVLVGNVQAARLNVRRLPEGQDFNRIWAPGAHGRATEVLHELKARHVYACFDLHNTTGENPPFSILAHLNEQSLELAARLQGPVMYAPWTKGPLNAACGHLFPCVTVELQKDRNIPLEQFVAEQIATMINRPNAFDSVNKSTKAPMVVEVQAIAYRRAASSHEGQTGHFEIMNGLDQYNFQMVPAGTVWASADPESFKTLTVLGPAGEDLTGHYFQYSNGQVVSTKPFLPTLLSTDTDAISQDCIAYITQPLAAAEISGRIRQMRAREEVSP
tara:strand:+ start:161 stop:1177 length:1017 start_codon:yes stop_codon:yes gene_type:complete